MNILCLDVGGTYIKSSVISEEEVVSSFSKRKTPIHNLQSLLKEIESIYRACSMQTHIQGLALSMPGLIDSDTGFMYTGGSLKYIQNIDMAKLLSACCDGLPVSVINDAKSGALAELRSGVLRDCSNGVLFVIGTALGGALVVDRQILTGKNHFAGEFSYLTLPDYPGDLSYHALGESCGSRAVAEIYQRKSGIAFSPEEVFMAAETGDGIALDAIIVYCDRLVIPLVNLQCTIDPETIAIGGGISTQPLLIALLKERIEKYQRDSGMCKYGMPKVSIQACSYPDNGMGAYYHFLDKYTAK